MLEKAEGLRKNKSYGQISSPKLLTTVVYLNADAMRDRLGRNNMYFIVVETSARNIQGTLQTFKGIEDMSEKIPVFVKVTNSVNDLIYEIMNTKYWTKTRTVEEGVKLLAKRELTKEAVIEKTAEIKTETISLEQAREIFNGNK